jgi:asparagine synthase (glutamine-hydrolysing)
MPGIAGLVARHPLGNEERTTQTMVDVAMHSPLYAQGTYSDSRLGAFIGYTCLKGSFADCMPICNQDHSLMMFVAGETYVDDSTLPSLQQTGPKLSPTQGRFLVHLYEQNPESFFRGLNGGLSGIVFDLRRRKVLLFNDRCGLQRIYYHENAEGFYFASEAKSLLAVVPALRELDPRGIGEFFNYDCVLENRTFFRNMHLLPPGSAWDLTPGKVHKKTYFDWRVCEQQPPLSEPQFGRELSATFDRVLPRYFREPRIGMALTGGLDTRMILSSRKPAFGELACYTFANDAARETLDVRLARQVATAAQQSHHTLQFEIAPFLANYPAQLERVLYVSDGLTSVIDVELLPLLSLARQIAPVGVSGMFGSQVLKHVVGFKERKPMARLLHLDLLPQVTAASHTKARLSGQHPLTVELTMDAPWFWTGFLAMEYSQMSWRCPFLDNDFLEVLYRAPAAQNGFGSRFQLEFIQAHNSRLARYPTDQGLILGGNPLLAWSRRGLVKALNFADAAYCHELFPGPLPRSAVRLDTWLSRLGLDRLCFGFCQFGRYRQWFREQLAGFLKDALLSARALQRPYWNPACLQKIVQDHTRGRANHLREIRKVLQLEMLHQVLLERKWPPLNGTVSAETSRLKPYAGVSPGRGNGVTRLLPGSGQVPCS